MLLLFTYAYSQLIRLQFAVDPDLFLAMEKESELFVPMSLLWINRLKESVCAIPSKRFIDGDFNEFYFCGRKLCYDTIENTINACLRNEKNTKWELVPQGNDQYLLKNNSMCVSLFGTSTVQMKNCDGRDMTQRLRVVIYEPPSWISASKEKTMAERELDVIAKLQANEEHHRRESLMIAQ